VVSQEHVAGLLPQCVTNACLVVVTTPLLVDVIGAVLHALQLTVLQLAAYVVPVMQACMLAVLQSSSKSVGGFIMLSALALNIGMP